MPRGPVKKMWDVKITDREFFRCPKLPETALHVNQQPLRWTRCARQMALDRRKLLLFGAAALIRALLFLLVPSLPDLLAGRVELSTPVTSFKRCTRSSLTGLSLAYIDFPFSEGGRLSLHP